MQLNLKNPIEAICYNGNNYEDVEDFCSVNNIDFCYVDNSMVMVDGLEVKEGEFVIMEYEDKREKFIPYICSKNYIQRLYKIVT